MELSLAGVLVVCFAISYANSASLPLMNEVFEDEQETDATDVQSNLTVVEEDRRVGLNVYAYKTLHDDRDLDENDALSNMTDAEARRAEARLADRSGNRILS